MRPTEGACLPWRAAILMYLTFVAGVILATWPLATRPATHWAFHHDPALFTWVMASMSRWLVGIPLHLFDGNAFYPYSESLAFSEPLLLPAVLGLPGFVWGNPILTYNLLVLLLWPVNGVAMAWAAHSLTGSRGAAWLAGAVFCLSPYFTEYHLEFNMLPAASIPVALVAWVRWLERQESRWLTVALAAFAIQGMTSWYYAVILSSGLAILTIGFVCLRWRGWYAGRDLAALGIGSVGVGVVLLPVAWPYLLLHRELGFERDLGETSTHYADLLSFVEPAARSLFFHVDWSRHLSETSPFVGYTVLALAASSVGWLRRDDPLSPAMRWLARLGFVLVAASLAIAGLGMALGPGHHHLASRVIRLRPQSYFAVALLAGLGVLVVRGWDGYRRRAPRSLTRGDWVRLLALLTAVSVVLALGPVLHVAGRSMGSGPYVGLHRMLMPLHAIRITVRFGVLTVAGLALLAAFGWCLVTEWTRGRKLVHRLLGCALILSLAAEYAVRPPAYLAVQRARSVDEVLRAEPDDVAVLEWPTMSADDTSVMFRSLYHGKRVMNGHSGFIPGSLHYLSMLLTTPGPPFPVEEAQAELRRVFPLRYLVVRLPDIPKEWRAVWAATRTESRPLLQFLGQYGDDDLYAVVSLPESAWRVERLVSHGFLRSHPLLEVGLRSLTAYPERRQFVDVRLNDRLLERIPLAGSVAARVPIRGALFHAAPNTISLEYGYAIRPGMAGERYQVGRTSASSPGDLWVRSAGQPYGDEAVIRFNGREAIRTSRGYNLVALSPDDRPPKAAVFDTFGDARAVPRLTAWIRDLAPGTVVAGAVRDEASALLTQEAVDALQSLGVGGDLRTRFRESHAFVGAKGAVPATALEGIGRWPVEILLGRSRDAGGFEGGFELTTFALK
jgi:hypothetical protein